MTDNNNTWDKISQELKESFPTLSENLKSKYSYLVKECFYAVFNNDDVNHMLWIIQMNNDVSKDTLSLIQSMFSAKIKKIKQSKNDIKENVNIPNAKTSFKPKEKTVISSNRYLLAWVVVIGFYILTYILMTKAIPAESNQVVFMLFGTISTGFGTVLAYFFGSSQGSESKNDILKSNINKKE